jgi:site-specific DNA-methyltransferase (cytosine-N4-specific)
MAKTATQNGFKNVSDYIRHLHARVRHEQRAEQPLEATPDMAARFPASLVRPYHDTRHGTIHWGDSRAYLFKVARPGSVDLIMTSPPFGLVRKKEYGNEDAADYCKWFRPFAEGFRRVLKETGSLVIDIGGAWIPGQPTRSLYHFKLLVMLCEEYGFHLAQEHYWWNPSKLPTPAEWVNVRRVRVKDAVNTVWWLSPTPWPKASNRRVLAPYSASMLDLLANGYTAKTRPSGHVISEKFGRDNGGAVPPNLLAIANTESSGQYQSHCRQQDIDIHPARFPSQLPEYFIRMLTDPGDLVIDPFAGSCVTGMVAEALGRRWACVELSDEYLRGAMARFLPHPSPLPKDRDQPYTLHAPCVLPAAEVPLAADGGAARPPLPSRGPKTRTTVDRKFVPPSEAEPMLV